MPELARAVNDGAHRLDAAAMPFDAGQSALFGPTAVAIHDNGDVLGTLDGKLKPCVRPWS